jgi:hypothetical protein
MKRLLVCLLLVGVVGCGESEPAKETPSNEAGSQPKQASPNKLAEQQRERDQTPQAQQSGEPEQQPPVQDGQADPNRKANGLFVAAVKLLASAEAKSLNDAIKDYEQALKNFRTIIDDYSESGLAVKLISGETLFAGKTLADIEARLKELRDPASGFADIDDLGKAVLAAIGSRDADKVMNLYVTPEVAERFKERLMEAAQDPLRRELIEKNVGLGDLLRPNRLINPTEESNKFEAKYQRIRDRCVSFLIAIDSESKDLTFDQINAAIFLGMAPMRTSDNGLKAAFDIDADEVGYMSAGNARVFVRHEEKVYMISVDSMEKVNGRWYISGDYFSINEVLSKIDLTIESWQHPHTQATLRKVNQYLPGDSN